ncbi:FxsA family protein [Pseudonocardia sp. MCCB 268]|nr:FxsA family protein [Pseudonocardia cytotoxica]
MQRGRLAHEEATDDLLIAISGVLIFLPGLISDVLGLALVFPPTGASPTAGWCDAAERCRPGTTDGAGSGTARPWWTVSGHRAAARLLTVRAAAAHHQTGRVGAAGNRPGAAQARRRWPGGRQRGRRRPGPARPLSHTRSRRDRPTCVRAADRRPGASAMLVDRVSVLGLGGARLLASFRAPTC